MRRSIFQFCLWLLLAGCLAACTILATEDGRLAVVVVGDHDDHVTWMTAEDGANFDIHSPSGIGRATVRLLVGPYPERIVLRFHLAGLEELRFAYDTTVVTVSIASSGETIVFQQVSLAAGESQTIGKDSPYWMATTIIANGVRGQNAIPLADGWIEVEAPRHFIAARASGFAIDWVDFFR